MLAQGCTLGLNTYGNCALKEQYTKNCWLLGIKKQQFYKAVLSFKNLTQLASHNAGVFTKEV